MEKFLKFKEKVSIRDLNNILKNPSIILLRESQTTETIQVQILDNLTDKDIRHAFAPFHIDKIFHEFPYPLKYKGHRSLSKISPLKNIKKFLGTR